MYSKNPVQKEKQTLPLVLAVVGALFVVGCVATWAIVKIARGKTAPAIGSQPPVDPVKPTLEPQLPTSVKLLQTYEKDGEYWTLVLVKPKLKQADLIEVAKSLRQKDPEMRWELFDDSSQSAQYVRWAEAYPGPSRPKFPEKWVNTHGVAMIMPIGQKWVLADAFASPITDLE